MLHPQPPTEFAVKHYDSTEHPVLKGPGFALDVVEDRETVEEFAAWLNAKLARLAELEAKNAGQH